MPSRRFSLASLRDRWVGIVVAGVFLLLLVASGVLLFLTFVGRISGAVATLAATLTLVVLTGLYAAITYRMMVETKKGREQEIRPVLEFHAGEYMSQIKNVGGGPARTLDITLSLVPDGVAHGIRHQSIPAGESVAVPAEPFSSIGDRGFLELQAEGIDIEWDETEDDDEEFWEEREFPYERLQMTGTCEDVWGNTYPIEEEHQAFDLTEGFGDAVSPTVDAEASLELVAIELQRIRRLLDENASEKE